MKISKKILIIFLIFFLSFSFAIYQYAKELKFDFVRAYSTSKPANGHSWSEMECTSGLCVTADNKVGIGTDSPTEKLQVAGSLKVTGDICNSAGNCLSALASLTNACGTAAKTYVYSATALSGTYCFLGNPTPASPAFPSAGSSTTWTCPVTSGSPISCTATHAAPTPVNGLCGSSNAAVLGSIPTSGLCYDAASPNVTGSGPWYWTCPGSNGGSPAQCSASYGVTGQCGSTEGWCVSGTASGVSLSDGASIANWTCNGAGIGTTATCSSSAKLYGLAHTANQCSSISNRYRPFSTSGDYSGIMWPTSIASSGRAVCMFNLPGPPYPSSIPSTAPAVVAGWTCSIIATSLYYCW